MCVYMCIVCNTTYILHLHSLHAIAILPIRHTISVFIKDLNTALLVSLYNGYTAVIAILSAINTA